MAWGNIAECNGKCFWSALISVLNIKVILVSGSGSYKEIEVVFPFLR